MTPHPPAFSRPHRSLNRLDSIRHALAGMGYLLRTQRNAWIHAAATLGIAGVGLWLQLDAIRCAILALAIGLVWMAEFVNTALEAVVDLACPDLHPLAKTGKDVAAAAVLIGAITSLIIGVLLLGPPLWARLAPAF